MAEEKIHIIDSNVFIHGAEIGLPFENMVTAPGVTAELESFQAKRRFEAEDVEIKEPKKESVDDVEEKAKNEHEEVSKTDINLLALALEMDAILVTDDYHMQNLAEKLGIEHKKFLKEGIEESRKWKKVCKNCGKEVEGRKCPVCGSGAEKKPVD